MYKLEKYKHKLMLVNGGGGWLVSKLTDPYLNDADQKTVFKQEYLRLKRGGAAATIQAFTGENFVVIECGGSGVKRCHYKKEDGYWVPDTDIGDGGIDVKMGHIGKQSLNIEDIKYFKTHLHPGYTYRNCIYSMAKNVNRREGYKNAPHVIFISGGFKTKAGKYVENIKTLKNIDEIEDVYDNEAELELLSYQNGLAKIGESLDENVLVISIGSTTTQLCYNWVVCGTFSNEDNSANKISTFLEGNTINKVLFASNAAFYVFEKLKAFDTINGTALVAEVNKTATKPFFQKIENSQSFLNACDAKCETTDNSLRYCKMDKKKVVGVMQNILKNQQIRGARDFYMMKEVQKGTKAGPAHGSIIRYCNEHSSQ